MGGLLAASGWNSRLCSGLRMDQAASGRCAGTRTEVREAASALFLFFAAWHIAIPASSWAAWLTSLVSRGASYCLRPCRRCMARPGCPPSITGFRVARSPCSRPRLDSRGLSSAHKACMHSGENFGLPRLVFLVVGEQGDPRGDYQAGRRTPSLHGAAVGVAQGVCPGPDGRMPLRPEELLFQGNIAPVNEVCAHVRPVPAPGDPRPFSGSLCGLYTRPSRCPDSCVNARPCPISCASFFRVPGAPPSTLRLCQTKRPALSACVRDLGPVPGAGPSIEEGAFRALGFFLCVLIPFDSRFLILFLLK